MTGTERRLVLVAQRGSGPRRTWDEWSGTFTEAVDAALEQGDADEVIEALVLRRVVVVLP